MGFVCIIYFVYCRQSQRRKAVQVASLRPFTFLTCLWGDEDGARLTSLLLLESPPVKVLLCARLAFLCGPVTLTQRLQNI